MNPPKSDIKGFDFKKATCAEAAEKFYMQMIEKHVLDSEEIEVKEMLKDINKFKEDIKLSIQHGERDFLPNAAAKEIAAYKNPESEQSVRGVLAWNMLNPTNQIELPSKVGLIKLNIFEEDDILPLKETNPDIYELIMEKIFNDDTGIFVTKEIDPGIGYVNVNKKEWYNDIPKKYRTKYKKLGPKAWNDYVDTFSEEELNKPGGLSEATINYKKRGMQVLAIPSNGTVPEWLQPYIDYNTMINNIIAPFVPVLEIFKTKTLNEGKSHAGVNRKTASITNIIKF